MTTYESIWVILNKNKNIHSQQTWAEGNERKKKPKKKNLIDSKSSWMVQISSEESATNGNHWESVTGHGLLATVHWQRFKASPVRTRRSVAIDLEMESGLIDDGEWRHFNGSSAMVNGGASMGSWRRWMATLRRWRFNGEWVSLFLFGFLSFFVWVSKVQWVSGWMFFFVGWVGECILFLFRSIYSGI